ncbi:MAG: hypothetical protein E7345_00400 [Clostridiales bacterium]|nr:hypothetical protein [Clostridiales bacterium]
MKKKFLIKNRKFSYKMIIVLILFLFALVFSFDCGYVSANENDFTHELYSGAIDVVDIIDFSELDEVVADIDNYELFENLSVREKIEKLLSGDFELDYSNVISVILSILFKNIRNILPLIFAIIGISMLTSMVLNFQTDNQKSDIVYFICFSLLVTIVIVAFKGILETTSTILNSIHTQMGIVFPILITLLASIGSMSAISIYNPLVAILTNGVNLIFSKLLFPMFIVILLFTILNSLTDNIKLDKFISFFTSTFKWVIGIVFTLFIGFLSIQGISAGKFDSVSIKATKFAVKSYIPIIGSYISDGMDFIVLGSILVKNSIGLIGVFVLFISIISPIITIVIFKLGLQLSSGVIELAGNNRMSSFISSCSKLLLLPIVLILGVALMYVITICLIMCTANII